MRYPVEIRHGGYYSTIWSVMRDQHWDVLLNVFSSISSWGVDMYNDEHFMVVI